MPNNIQNTRNSTRVRRKRQNTVPITREYIRQQCVEPRIPRRIRLPQVSLMQWILLAKPILKDVGRVRSRYNGFR